MTADQQQAHEGDATTPLIPLAHHPYLIDGNTHTLRIFELDATGHSKGIRITAVLRQTRLAVDKQKG